MFEEQWKKLTKKEVNNGGLKIVTPSMQLTNIEPLRMTEKEIILSDLSWQLQFVFNKEHEAEFEKEFQISYSDVNAKGQVFRDWLAKRIRDLRRFNRQVKSNPQSQKAYEEHKKKVVSTLLYGSDELI